MRAGNCKTPVGFPGSKDKVPKTKEAPRRAMDPRRVKKLPYVPQISQKLATDDDWGDVARSYIKDHDLLHGIQSLELYKQKNLEDARSFIANHDPKNIRGLKNRAAILQHNYALHSTSLGPDPDPRTKMWDRMAVMVFEVVQERKKTHERDFGPLSPFVHHCEVVAILLFEILADAESPPGSFLKDRYLDNIVAHSDEEGYIRSSNRRKRALESQRADEEVPSPAVRAATDEKPDSTVNERLTASVQPQKRNKKSKGETTNGRRDSQTRFEDPGETTVDGAFPAKNPRR